MLQIRSILDVADNTGAKRAAAIGVLGRNQKYAGIGDVIKAHIKEAAPDGTVKKGDVVNAVVVRTRQAFAAPMAATSVLIQTLLSLSTRKTTLVAPVFSGRLPASFVTRSS